jgi:histidinol dehydrogenase
MKSKFYSLMIGLFAVLAILSLADVSHAQRIRNKRESRNKMMNKAQVKAVINRVEDRVDNFVKNYDKSLDKSKLNGSSREDWLMNRARDLESATDELSREFDRRDAWAENKDEVRKCLNIATDIDTNMKNYKFGAATESNWSRVRYELNTLADIYNLPRVGAGTYK